MKEIKAKDTLSPLCYYDFCDGAYEFYISHVLGDAGVNECPHPEGSDKWKGWHHARLSRELKVDLAA